MDELLHDFSENGEKILDVLLVPLLIIAAGIILIRVCDRLIGGLTKARLAKASGTLSQKRIETLEGLLKNLVKYAVCFIVIITVLDRFHVPVMAILSTAGVLGVALAFGAQSLCRDIITGFFILLEDQYFVGEYIEAQGVAGYVEQLTMRCTYLRDFDGRLHILPNGGMNLVTNHHRGGSRVLAEVSVPYEADIGEALRVLQNACDGVSEDYKELLREKITVLGVTDLAASGVTLRMQGQAEPMRQWEIERALRKKAKEALDAAGIAIPYPHMQIVAEEGAGSHDV